MIAHVLLFRLRGDLDSAARAQLADAFAAALRDVPALRRARVGTRVIIGRPYDQLMRVDYPYAAVLEFDDEAGLRAYLERPAHEPLAKQFFAAVEETLVYDFDLMDASEGIKTFLYGEG